MSDYRFSVLMSVYERENPEYFSLAMESVLINQTLLPDEMILVCDGPLTDELEAVIVRYKNEVPKILKIYRLESNVGLGSALNYGLEYCTYNLVARADSDDVCAPTRFEEQIGFLKKYPETDIVGSNIDEFNEDWKHSISEKKMPTVHDDIVKMAKFRNPINHMTVLFRKSVVIGVGSYKHLPYVEDYYLWVRAICNGARIANINHSLVHARIGNGMIRRRSNKECIVGRRVLSKYMLDNGMITKTEYYRNMLSIYFFVYMPTGVKVILYKHILRK